ncbi:hypothetical protein [Streptomyces sporangiiformans]|uniref:Uncharacterized protein n=1 Tax=Streptomyces sporangiiformans TaxID=2315329 RepID=A0A505D221_9ACTN|nr:hypothetical protein [Streptomyces sporangiiformans]TPQ16640.1 hypothetical protein FGD71_040715 [Streptomyces sporangiiformans]
MRNRPFRRLSAALVAAAALVTVGAASPATAAPQQASADYWRFCWMAPAGSLKVTFADGDTSCLSGQGFVGFDPNDPAWTVAKIETNNNWGRAVHPGTVDPPMTGFDRNQTLSINSRLNGIYLNTAP